MIDTELYKERLRTIHKQLSEEQIGELFDMLMEVKEFQPPGYPSKGIPKVFGQLNDKEIKYLHDKFITLQFSFEPWLGNKDIRGIYIPL